MEVNNVYVLNFNDAVKMFSIHIDEMQYHSAFNTFLILRDSFFSLKENYPCTEDDLKSFEKEYNNAYNVMMLRILLP